MVELAGVEAQRGALGAFPSLPPPAPPPDDHPRLRGMRCPSGRLRLPERPRIKTGAAFALLDRALAEDSRDAGALSLYATLLSKEGRVEEARQVAQRLEQI